MLAALYILLTYQRMFTGPVQEFAAGWKDMDVREAWVVGPLLAIIIALGFYPEPVLDVIEPGDRPDDAAGAHDRPRSERGGIPAAEGTNP